MRHWSSIGAGAFALALLLSGCDEEGGTLPVEPEPEPGPHEIVQRDDRRYGETAEMGEGGVQTWIQVDGSLPPVWIG